MKVHSWKHLLASIIIGGGMTAWGIVEAINTRRLSTAICMFPIVITTIRGLKLSFSEEALKEERRRGAEEAAILRKHFGKFGVLLRFGFVIPFIAMLVLALAFPGSKPMAIAVVALFLVMLAYIICFENWMKKQKGE